MTRAQAQAKIRKLIKEAFYLRAGEEISGPERRAKVAARLQQIRETREFLDAEIHRRLNELNWWREMISQKTDLWKEQRKIEGWEHYERFEVVQSRGIFNEIIATGDTWEEVVRKLEGARK